MGISPESNKSLNQNHHTPFICVFSGDVSHSASDSDFANAEIWLNNLSRAVGNIPFFIIPGNHDVRRPQNRKKINKVTREFTAAANNGEAYTQWVDTIRKSEFLQPFFSWHENMKTKTRLNIISTWNRSSPFICHYRASVAGINVHLIGLNTSMLSCRDREQEKLVADINCLEEALAQIKTETELVILVTHHPIKVDEKLERWLAAWNDTQLADIVLRQTGPHLYLHGHLHESIGIGTSQSTGQYVALFSAGAAYQHDKYPMKFGFYDISLTGPYNIKPWIYGFDRSSGVWSRRDSESHPVFTLLPVPPNAGKKELRDIVNAQQTERDALIQERESLRKAYKYCHKAAHRLFREMHPTSGGAPIHHYERLQSYYKINGNGDAAINETVVIFPKGENPVHFWEYGIWADPESPEVPFLEDISWNVSVDDEGKNVTYLPTRDDGRAKWICVFFLPMIGKDEKRTVNISYQWPAFVRHLIDGDRVQFEWHFKTGLPLVPINVDLILDFDPNCGDLEFKQENSHDPESEWTSTRTENGGTRLEYRCENGLLLHDGYKITVWKCDSSTSESACAGHF